MPHDWIADRLPTEADGDEDGDVRVPGVPGRGSQKGDEWWFQHYSLIVPGQPWWSEKAAERVEVEPAPAFSFAVGQLWRRRNGEVVRVTQVDPGADLPVCVDNGYWQRADGTSCLNCSEYDLIELVSGPEPAPAPTRKVVQIAVGVELLLLCDDGTMWAMKTNGGPWTQLPAIPQPEA